MKPEKDKESDFQSVAVNEDRLLAFVRKKGQVSPAAVRYLASLAIAGEVVQDVIGMPAADVKYNGEIVKRREDIIQENKELIDQLNMKAEALGIIAKGGFAAKERPISKGTQEYLKKFLTGESLGDIGGNAYSQVELGLEKLKKTSPSM